MFILAGLLCKAANRHMFSCISTAKVLCYNIYTVYAFVCVFVCAVQVELTELEVKHAKVS